MEFYCECDEKLVNQLGSIKAELEYALELIKECNEDRDSDYYTGTLEKDIRRFIEDHCTGD